MRLTQGRAASGLGYCSIAPGSRSGTPITLCLRLNKSTDKDIIEILESKESKSGYIKELIRQDNFY